MGQQHTNMCDRPIGVVQQTGVNLDGELFVCLLAHLHQRLIALETWWIFEEKQNRETDKDLNEEKNLSLGMFKVLLVMPVLHC